MTSSHFIPRAAARRLTSLALAARLAVLLATQLAAGLAAAVPLPAQSRRHPLPPAVVDNGRGPEAWVLLTGLVGGVAGFRRLQARLEARGDRVIVIDPWLLSLDSADLSFHAVARRVDRELAARGVARVRLVGHSHGGGVALRLAAGDPSRVVDLHLLDVGALAAPRGPVLGRTIRLIPLITRIPGGRAFVRDRFARGLRENSVGDAWLDDATLRAYTEPLLDGIDQVAAMALRLARTEEPEPVAAVVARVRVPVILVLGGERRPAGPSVAELDALAPLGILLRTDRIAGTGHFPHEEAPDELARLLLRGPAAQLAQAREAAP